MATQGLNGRIAVVTGATAGIGLAVSRALGRQGARLVVNGRRRERAEALAAELGQGDPGRARAVAGDCADEGVIEAMLDAARSFGAEADLVVVNAGRGLNGSVLSSDATQWEEMVRTNVLGAARLIRAAGNRMSKEAGGAPDAAAAMANRPRDIVVIGSVVGRHVSPFSSMYGSTKFAVHGMVEGVRRELGPRGVRISLVEPGFVISEFQGVAGYTDAWFEQMKAKFGPMLSPEDIADAVSYMVTRPGHVHVSDILVRPTRQEYP